MGTCDFFHQWTQTHPSRTGGRGWGRGTGGGEKLFLAPRRVAQVLTQGEWWPSSPGKRLRRSPPPPLFRGRDPSRAATRPADPATWARTRPERRERGLEGWGRQGCGRGEAAGAS